MDNTDTLREFYRGIVSGDYYDGMRYSLCLDRATGALTMRQEASGSTWYERETELVHVQGCDDPAPGYEPGDNLDDHGYSDWAADIEARIEEALAT